MTIKYTTAERPILDETEIGAGDKQPWQMPRMRGQDFTKGKQNLTGASASEPQVHSLRN